MQIRELAGLIGSRRGRRWLRHTLRKRLYARHVSIGLRRDMSIPFTVPSAQIPLVVRHVEPDDDLSFIADDPRLPPEAAQHRADQRWLLNSALPTCWVALDTDGVVQYMAWFLTARDNALIRTRWGEWLPQLRPDEALVEGVYVAPGHRGLGIMTDASCRIADRAVRELGVRYVMGIISETNIGPLRAGEKAGFAPYLVREDKWLLFRRSIRFVPAASAESRSLTRLPRSPVHDRK